jgi:hypothetical protein
VENALMENGRSQRLTHIEAPRQGRIHPPFNDPVVDQRLVNPAIISSCITQFRIDQN